MESRTMTLRHEAQRQLVARLLMLGWTAERIAKRLRVMLVAVSGGNGLSTDQTAQCHRVLYLDV